MKTIYPVPKPRITVATNICVNDFEKYSIAHARICGKLTINMARLRPSGPTINPEQKAPNGWHMDDMLPKCSSIGPLNNADVNSIQRTYSTPQSYPTMMLAMALCI